MRFRSACAAGWSAVILASGALNPGLIRAQARAAIVRDAAPPTGRWRDVSLDEYRQHLAALRQLTETCAKARDLKSCDPTLVGPDDRIPMAANGTIQRRMVRYGWLRVLLYKANEPDKADEAAGPRDKKAGPHQETEAGPRPAPRTTSQLLQDADVRLTHDLEQAGSGAVMGETHGAQRAMMKQVLAEREFRDLEQAAESDTVLEKVGNWLNHVFAGFTRLRARSAWVGRALVWIFFLGVAALLAWRLARMERRWKSGQRSNTRIAAPTTISARDWQLWLADAKAAATAGRWREAIRFMYWASIARLESRRVWPADRARTPREYLALLTPEDPRRQTLAELTRAFERTWYGGRKAGETEYLQAEELANGLIGAAEAGAP